MLASPVIKASGQEAAIAAVVKVADPQESLGHKDKSAEGVDLILIGAHGAILARFAAQSEIGTCEIRPIYRPKKAGRGVAE